jgi:hypothetical protein
MSDADTSVPPPDLSGYMPRADAEVTIAGFNTRITALETRAAVFLDNITLAQSATLAISAGPRTLTVPCNCLPGDRMFVTPAAPLPSGYMLGDISCVEAGKAVVTLFAPLLAVGASYSITARVTGFR